MPRKPLLVLLSLLLIFPIRIAAWNSTGHEIIAAIAEVRLSSNAKALVRELVGDTPLSSPEIAGWADKVGDKRSRPWHYVNIPFSAAHYDPQRDCSRNACAVAALEREIAILSSNASPLKRADALRWLVHLVGDLHQPLHAGDGRDRGGNDQPVRMERRKQTKNPHRIWDVDVLAPLIRRRDPSTVARALEREITPNDARNWASDLRPSSWAEQSNLEARAIYAELDRYPTDRSLFQLPAKYTATQEARVQLALKRAGVRLAALLEEIARSRAVEPSRSP